MPVSSFEFATANQIRFGVGTFNEVGKLARGLGQRALVVLGVQNPKAVQLSRLLDENGIVYYSVNVDREPTLSLVLQIQKIAEESQCNLIIGFGGGSAIDTAKAISVLRNNPGDLIDYLEVIGKGKPLQNPALPCIAIPTTAGTGAEVTRNAVIGVPHERIKVSLRSPYMLPRLAVIDPELTLSLPPSITVSTGLDALTQVIEPFVSNKANPITDALCKEGILRAARSLKRVFHDGSDLEAREDLCLTSLCGGMALANSKLGAVHGFAGVIGGMFDGPHGAICARLLPVVMAANIRALQARDPSNLNLRRYREVAVMLTGKANAQALDGVHWLEELLQTFSIPMLSSYGLKSSDIQEVAEKSSRSSSMAGNPIQLTPDELYEILALVV